MSTDKIAPTSRYAAVERAELTRADGAVVPYLRRRFLPLRSGTVLARHTVSEGDRPDTVASTYLNDPEQYWRLCDYNETLHPRELTGEIGRSLRITLPGDGDDA